MTRLAVVAGQLGQLAWELSGQVTGLAAGQPLTQHGQDRPGRPLGVVAGVEPAPLLDSRGELVERHGAALKLDVAAESSDALPGRQRPKPLQPTRLGLATVEGRSDCNASSIE
jgi:hypothetical protein